MQLPDGISAWQVWLSLAIGLGVLELFSLDLILLMLAAGAVVGMVLDLAGLAVWVQVLAAVAASIARTTAFVIGRRRGQRSSPVRRNLSHV